MKTILASDWYMLLTVVATFLAVLGATGKVAFWFIRRLRAGHSTRETPEHVRLALELYEKDLTIAAKHQARLQDQRERYQERKATADAMTEASVPAHYLDQAERILTERRSLRSERRQIARKWGLRVAVAALFACALWPALPRIRFYYWLHKGDSINTRWGRGDKREGIAAYKEAIKIDPRSARAHQGLGDLYRYYNAYNRAIQEYRRVIELDPTLAEPYYALGEVLLEVGQKAEAKEKLLVYVRLIDDAYPSVLPPAEWVKAREILGRLGSAPPYTGAPKPWPTDPLESPREEVLSNPDSATAHIGYGTALVKLYKVNEARKEFNKAVALAPKNKQAKQGLTLCAKRQREMDAGVARLQRVQMASRKLGVDDQVWCYELADNLAANGQQAEAILAYESFLRVAESEPLGEKGWIEGARRSLRKLRGEW
jgi:tetratricopeptide (TPR) repeat protein